MTRSTKPMTRPPRAGSHRQICRMPISRFRTCPFAFSLKKRIGHIRVEGLVSDHILDVSAVSKHLTGLARGAAEACADRHLNALMELGPSAWRELRHNLFQLLKDSAKPDAIRDHLVPMASASLLLPIKIPNFTDFFASVFHATNAGSLFRRDNPLLANYKYVPIAYHGRASSIVVDGTDFRRPKGQTVASNTTTPVLRACQKLDHEVELGFYVGVPNCAGQAVPVATARTHIFGASLLNDWSARDIQAWEYQPLGPFLAKNFATTVSPWVIMAQALVPFRTFAFERPVGDPAPLPHLSDPQDQATGGYDITLRAYIQSERMRELHLPPQLLSSGTVANSYWTVAQMIAHHTSNGCNLETGDLLGTGTMSGPERESWGSLLELTANGTQPISLPTGETRRFLEDGDLISIRGYCHRAGYARIGFGDCSAVVLSAET